MDGKDVKLLFLYISTLSDALDTTFLIFSKKSIDNVPCLWDNGITTREAQDEKFGA